MTPEEMELRLAARRRKKIARTEDRLKMEAHAATQRQNTSGGAEQNSAGSDLGLEADRSSTPSSADHLGMLAAVSRDARAASPVTDAAQEGPHTRERHSPTGSDAAPDNSGLTMLLAGAAAVDTKTRGDSIMSSSSVDLQATHGADAGRRGQDAGGSSQTILDGDANVSGRIATSDANFAGAGEACASNGARATASDLALVSREPQEDGWQSSFPGELGEASSQVQLASLIDEEVASAESSSGEAGDDDDEKSSETRS